VHVISGKPGWIEVICGPMFSGKSEELIRRIRRAEIARQRVQIFKNALDARYDATSIVSHSQQSLPSVAVDQIGQVYDLIEEGTEVVAIDEGQFFTSEIVSVCNQLASRRLRVIVAGLDLDYCGEPFGSMPELMATAEYVSKQLAICMVCGDPANFTQRLTDDRDRIVVGAIGTYEARCRRHFTPPQDGATPPSDRSASATPTVDEIS